MTIYEVIEDEFCKALEAGHRPPQSFSITFAEPEFMALLGSIVDSRTGLRMPINTASVALRLFGHDVTVHRAGGVSEDASAS